MAEKFNKDEEMEAMHVMNCLINRRAIWESRCWWKESERMGLKEYSVKVRIVTKPTNA